MFEYTKIPNKIHLALSSLYNYVLCSVFFCGQVLDLHVQKRSVWQVHVCFLLIQMRSESRKLRRN